MSFSHPSSDDSLRYANQPDVRAWYGQVRLWLTRLGGAWRLARVEILKLFSAKLLMITALITGAPYSLRARAEAPVAMFWDQDLAFDYDRENYQRTLTNIVQTSYSMVQAEIGWTPQRALRIQVYAPAHYEKEFGAAAAATRGAHYRQGAIYVNGGKRLNDRFAGLMVHELTHAFIDFRGTGHRIPIWLNEGLAERLYWKREGLDTFAPNQLMSLQAARRQGALTPLPTSGVVKLDYLQFYAAALFVEKKVGKDKMLALIKRTLEGEPFERALDREVRWTMSDLEREFLAWVDLQRL